MRKIRLAMCFMLCIVLGTSMNVFARDDINIPESSGNEKTVHVEAQVPEGYNESLEIYFNGSRYSLLSQVGYKADFLLEAGEYKVNVISPSDINNWYNLEYEPVIRVSNDMDYTIRVTETEAVKANEEMHDEHVVTGETMETASVISDPELYDFSDGNDYGTIFVTMKTYPAIKDATFRLNGNGRLYDIVLKNEYLGMAEVRLPVGDYYEASTLELSLDGDAVVPDGTSFLWQHRDNPGFFGNYYTVKKGEAVTIDDLYVVMNHAGDSMEFNSNALYAKHLMDNLETQEESHYREELESAFPERFDEKPTETIPEAVIIEEEEPAESLGPAIAVAAAAAALVLLGVLIIRIIRRRRER